jgi:hypothetical protein
MQPAVHLMPCAGVWHRPTPPHPRHPGGPMDINSEYLEWLELFGDAARRRCWLLWKALECSPLDRAIDLARAADQFVSHAPAEDRIVDASSHPTSVALPQPSSELTHSPLEVPVLPEPASQKRTPLALSPERREHLLQRLAQGARNAELASEFGLSKQQVQGVRMGSARQIANRRHTVDEQERQENGEFLVNARFKLPLEGLISRANRMRTRREKPEFRLADHQPSGASHPTSVTRAGNGELRNGQSIF